MARRRMVIAFVEIENPRSRAFRQAATGMSVDDIIAEPRKVWLKRGLAGSERFTFWCAADRPDTDDTFQVAPVHRTSEVPEDAECEVCGVSIRELQEMFT